MQADIMAESLGILLVDNEESDAELFRIAVEFAGLNIQLHRVTDGQKAIDYLSGKGIYKDGKEYPVPDLIVVGLFLPVVSGLDFLKWCRTAAICRHLPVVVWTGGLKSEEPVQEALKAGADRLYFKSASMENTENTIREIFSLGMERKKARKSSGGPRLDS